MLSLLDRLLCTYIRRWYRKACRVIPKEVFLNKGEKSLKVKKGGWRLATLLPRVSVTRTAGCIHFRSRIA